MSSEWDAQHDVDAVNRMVFPRVGKKYSGTKSTGLVWLCGKLGNYFPSYFVRKRSSMVILYTHGNGGSLADFKDIVSLYAEWYSSHLYKSHLRRKIKI